MKKLQLASLTLSPRYCWQAAVHPKRPPPAEHQRGRLHRRDRPLPKVRARAKPPAAEAALPDDIHHRRL